MATLDFTNRKSQEEFKKLPKPTNNSLEKLFENVDKVVIKESGVSNCKAINENVVLSISRQDNIDSLKLLLEIDENNTGFHCMCLGDHAIELFSGVQLKATIGFHHGVSIRYDNWNGDAELAQSDDLLAFFAELGLTKPLQDRILDKNRSSEAKVAEANWLNISPRCFNNYGEKFDNTKEFYFSQILNELNIEFPDKPKQIIALLQSFGKSKNFWTGYPQYEELPKDILETFEIKEIIESYINSDRNYKTRKGLGRYLCSFDFKKVRKGHLKYITQEVIDDLEKCFERLGEKRGINEIFSLQIEKNKSESGALK